MSAVAAAVCSSQPGTAPRALQPTRSPPTGPYLADLPACPPAPAPARSLETSSVLIRELPLDVLIKPKYWPDYHPTAYEPSSAVPQEGQDYPANDMIAGACVGGT